MSDNNNILFKASFNPILRSYIFLYGGFTLIISIIGIPLAIIWFCGLGQ